MKRIGSTRSPVPWPTRITNAFVMLDDAKALIFLPQQTFANTIASRCCNQPVVGVAYEPQQGDFSITLGEIVDAGTTRPDHKTHAVITQALVLYISIAHSSSLKRVNAFAMT